MAVSYNTAGYTKEEYASKLRSLSDDDLLKEAEQYIWLSAYASNNLRSAYHWMVDMVYDEARRRDRTGIYRLAYRRVYMSEFGTDPHPDDGPLYPEA